MKYFSLTLFVSLLLTGCPESREKPLQGQVEFDEIDLASRLSSRVKEVKVELGDRVSADQVLVILDDDLIAIRNERAQATLEQASLQKKMTDDATRKEELSQLAAAEAMARSQWDFARQSLKRAGILFEKDAIARQQWEEIIAKEKGARAQYEMAKARWEAGRNGARDEQKAIAAANLVQAETGLAEVSAYHKDLQLSAAAEGTVHAIHARPGELVPQGFPLVTLLDQKHPRLSFYVTEDRLALFRQGETYTAVIPALQDMALKVELVRIQVLPAVLTQVVTEDRAARDIRSFELTFKPLDAAVPLQPGMSAVLVPGERK
ncbi:MAG TPA: efflux RND transporter periplasmic adaptor subunit [Oligoflexus sp.]|uniref:HlyD family secretion protein n=1 Tax=Oligoflexus sp. TaxID=1971216 RepID=UPI002D802E06|nr:efflux RND transporter periplasmic adaptor subunit [Oligoflexus sp.]HET9235861.1 efflux RND transporter periplasmic adaptor subunit [Oligoflexus sp.]